MSSKRARKLQLGQEATAGTAVAATTRWNGEGVLEDNRELVFPSHDVGIYSPTDQSYTPKLEAGLKMEETEETFEQSPHIMQAGIKKVTPVADGVGSGQIWTFPFPVLTGNELQPYTIEGGDDQQAEEMEYAFVKSFTLSGGGGESCKISASWDGRQISKTTFTADASAPIPAVLEALLFGKSKLYIDAVGGTIGTTQISDTFLKYALTVVTGWKGQHSGDGELFFNHLAYDVISAELQVTFEHNAAAVAQKDAWIAETPKLVQIKTEGSALATPGTDYTYKTRLINLAGKWMKWDTIGAMNDGNDIISGTFKMGYNATAAFNGSLVYVNELAALP